MTSLAPINYTPPKDPLQFIKEQAEQAGKYDPARHLPAELLMRILRLLPLQDLFHAAAVSRQWRRISSDGAVWKDVDLKQACPWLRILDDKVWKRHVDLPAFGLQVDDLPSLNKVTALRILTILSEQFANLRVERAGATLVIIPKGLTLPILHKIATASREGNQARITVLWGSIIKAISFNPATYRVLVTDSILEGSWNLSIGAQRELVTSLGCDMPDALVVATQILLAYISSKDGPPVRLYGANQTGSIVCTSCSNVVPVRDGIRNVIVGVFGSRGLDVRFALSETRQSIGVAAMKKIPNVV